MGEPEEETVGGDEPIAAVFEGLTVMDTSTLTGPPTPYSPLRQVRHIAVGCWGGDGDAGAPWTGAEDLLDAMRRAESSKALRELRPKVYALRHQYDTYRLVRSLWDSHLRRVRERLARALKARVPASQVDAWRNLRRRKAISPEAELRRAEERQDWIAYGLALQKLRDREADLVAALRRGHFVNQVNRRELAARIIASKLSAKPLRLRHVRLRQAGSLAGVGAGVGGLSFTAAVSPAASSRSNRRCLPQPRMGFPSGLLRGSLLELALLPQINGDGIERPAIDAVQGFDPVTGMKEQVPGGSWIRSSMPRGRRRARGPRSRRGYVYTNVQCVELERQGRMVVVDAPHQGATSAGQEELPPEQEELAHPIVPPSPSGLPRRVWLVEKVSAAEGPDPMSAATYAAIENGALGLADGRDLAHPRLGAEILFAHRLAPGEVVLRADGRTIATVAAPEGSGRIPIPGRIGPVARLEIQGIGAGETWLVNRAARAAPTYIRRPAYVLPAGRRLTFEVDKAGEGPLRVNMHVHPRLPDTAGKVILRMADPPSAIAENVVVWTLTQPEREFPVTLQAGDGLFVIPEPRASYGAAIPVGFTIGSDVGPGRHSVTVELEGSGELLVRTLVSAPVTAGKAP